jgi:ribose transport system substrate-binding protein
MATLLKVLNNLADIKSAGGVALRVRTQQDPKCAADGCLAKGRLVTPQTIGTIDNLWSRDYK